ncbi:WG repeat-containing protein [Spirosoma sp. BT702]|uniref:WG repeat-containing protein n=1 Tax=Spirosoma profusum TaxID=2771354 RepID=A0A926Y498_9BACT|nr:WG repeat-containing protein [Spirosoma profusum]MBD2702876.1 WG repeat-containing protein [Spirosoma profusum]
MQLNLKPYYWLAIGVVLVFILLGIIGNVLIPNGVDNPSWRKAGPYVVFGLFLVMVMAMVPIVLQNYLSAQHKIGNGNVPMVQFIARQPRLVVFGFWIMMGLGVAMALPYMIKDGFFTPSEPELASDAMNGLPDELYPVRIGEKWGYINNKAQLVIQPQFDRADDFSEGLAVVTIVSVKGETTIWKDGYIDQLGNVVIPCQFDKAHPFSENMGRIEIDGKTGFIDRLGRMAIPPRFEEASDFSESRAVAKMNGRNGFINLAGEWVVQPKFERASWVSEFSEGLAAVYTTVEDGPAGYVDKTGSFAFDPKFDYVEAFSEGLAQVRPKGSSKYGYINRKGEWVIPAQYELGMRFSEGVAAVKRSDGKGWQLIDLSGKSVSGVLPYLFVGMFQEGLAGVESKDHRWGFIDKTGREVIPTEYATVTLFKNGLARMEKGRVMGELKMVYLNREGKIAWQAE